MKTIFIPIFSGIEGKNFLRGGIFDALFRGTDDLQVIFFVGNEKRADYYRREYKSERVRFEVINRYRRQPLDRLFSFIKFYSLQTKTIDLKRRTNYFKTKNVFRFCGSFLANRILGARRVRGIVRALDAALTRDPVVSQIFETYHPAAVFLSDLFEDTEISMLREARLRGVPSIGFLSSWDRLTSRWGIRLLPDRLIVFNELLRDEAVEYAGMKAEKIFVSGAVQLDLHILKKPMPRAEFMRGMNLSPDTKLIIYGPLGRTFDATNQLDADMIHALNQSLEEGKLGPGKYKIIVRFPPNDFVDQSKLRQLSHVVYDIPGVRFATVRGQDWDMKPEELDHLRNLLANASLVICYYSSLSVDAAVFDVPIINVNFYLSDPLKRHPYYETTHYSKVKAVGGIALVQSLEELLSTMCAYLENPGRDRERRRVLVAEQAYKLDGKSAERIGNFIITTIRDSIRPQ